MPFFSNIGWRSRVYALRFGGYLFRQVFDISLSVFLGSVPFRLTLNVVIISFVAARLFIGIMNFRSSKNWVLLTLFSVTISVVSFAERTSFNRGWKFIQEDASGAELVGFSDSLWRTLDLPHDWSIEGEYTEDNAMSDRGGYLPAGIGWYRKTVEVPRDWKGKRIEIAFDGVFMNSTVWANGKKLGHRPYGWISFAYDVSDIVDASNSITFAVRVDNDKQPAARWYTGSGIYANTWIDVKSKVHVPHDGIFIRTEGSLVKIDTEVFNVSSHSNQVELKTFILDTSGQEVAKAESSERVLSGNKMVVKQTIELDRPDLWSVETPTLYTAVTELHVRGEVVDRMETRFGIRDVEWIAETGVWLNGKNVKLRGVCNHQDAGALGSAVPDKILRFRIQQLKNMGVNAIRVSHNPQTPQFYDMCDEIGMLVMDEIFDGWKRKAEHDYGAHSFEGWWERDVTAWIKRDRNHPSILIYSVGNETSGPVAKDLVALCNQLDDTRPVTSGHSGSEHMNVHGVNGSSEKMGWFEHLADDEVFKDKVFIGTENTHTWQVRGFYRTQTWFRDGFPNARQKPYPLPDLTDEEVFTYDWILDEYRSNGKQIFNSSYDNAMVRVTSRLNIAQLRDIPQYAGSFRWTGHDYIGEAGYVHGGWPFKSFMGGAIDMANFEKDLFYLYQSQWTEDPMVHILPHWTHPTLNEGVGIPVWVYSNCDSVELFLNGISLGKYVPGTEWTEMQCEWIVPWTPGTLKAVGYKNGIAVTEEIIRTADAPVQNVLSIDGKPLAEVGEDIVQVRVSALDGKGEFYPYGENRTHFHVIGPAAIKALDNGSPIDVEKHFQATDRIAFYGLTRAYVEATGEKGNIALLASCILGEKKLTTSKFVSIDTQVLSLRGSVPELDIDVYYTTDGSKPTKASRQYTEAFDLELGTTVKALIVVNGEVVDLLEERFAKDEGFVWDSGQRAASVIGEQAENARFEGGVFSSTGVGFHGKGFVTLDGVSDSYVEWYQENDGSAGTAELSIRYSGARKGHENLVMRLSVNGKIVEKALALPKTFGKAADWKMITVTIPFERGANAIRLSTTRKGFIHIDKIIVN